MNNGGEFHENELEGLCKMCGIERNKTTPYTP
jgi:hypothetical protein